jgi:flagellar biosynthesis protein FlhB
MAEQNNDQERTEQATEKRLREAREKGDLPRSRDLSAAMVTLAGAGTLLALRPWLGTHFRDLMRIGLSYGREQAMGGAAIGAAVTAAGSEALKLLAPLFGVALPALAALMVVNLGFGAISRAAPSMNLFSIGFPISICLGFVAVWLGLRALPGAFDALQRAAFDLIRAISGV